MYILPINTRAKTTALKQPKELFTFNRDENGEFHYDPNHENINYYYFPNTKIDENIDLQSGFKNFKQIPIQDNLPNFKSFFKFLIEYEKENGKVSSDIVTFRGIMTRILSLPNNLSDPIDLYIVAYDGSLFVKLDDEMELKRQKDQDNRQRQTTSKEKYEFIKKCEYAGYKFETITTLKRPWADTSRSTIEKRNKKVVNNYEQFLSVIKTGIGKNKIVLIGEVDCCWNYVPDEKSKILSNYVELKTTRLIENNMQVVNFESKKLFKTWCQCFLMGITKIIYGFRDDNLILRNIEFYNTDEIPVMLKNNPLTHNSDKKVNCTNCLKWYGAVVDWLNDTINKQDETKSYKLKYDPNDRSFTVKEVSKERNEKLRNGELLSEEFKEWRQSLKNNNK
ncbi:unnamed protein product [Candida verbasci]|uniref:Decapping nuclease n=1 Tax=Candida verbasci TaxID=1227364 RepID=A0A9W4TUM3_9ASCO|nr:unnamed protein product [Candida verbasci]